MELNKKYGDYSKMVGVTELTEKDNTIYDIKFIKGSKLYAVDFSSDGEIIKEQKYVYQDAN
jgi:hypothetical protein